MIKTPMVFNDECIIEVVSYNGSVTGVFAWPKVDMDILNSINDSQQSSFRFVKKAKRIPVTFYEALNSDTTIDNIMVTNSFEIWHIHIDTLNSNVYVVHTI